MSINSNFNREGATNVKSDFEIGNAKIATPDRAKWDNLEVFEEEQKYVNSAKETGESRKAVVRGQQMLLARKVLNVINKSDSMQQLRKMSIF